MPRGFILFGVLLLSLFSKSFAEVETFNIVRAEKKGNKECRNLYPKSHTNVNSIKNPDVAFDSAKYFECMADFVSLVKLQNPQNEHDSDYNKEVDSKVYTYVSNFNFINNKFALGLPSSTHISNMEETITEIVIVKAEAPRIQDYKPLPEPKSLAQAELRCKDRGFNKKSFDELEVYLFHKCVEEYGFTSGSKRLDTYKDAADLKRSITHKKESLKKKKQERKVEIKKQQKIKKEQVQKKHKTPTKTPIEVKETGKKGEVIKTEIIPIKKDENVNYVKKTVCKIDDLGNKVCIYNPQYKIEGATSINNFNSK